MSIIEENRNGRVWSGGKPFDPPIASPVRYSGDIQQQDNPTRSQAREPFSTGVQKPDVYRRDGGGAERVLGKFVIVIEGRGSRVESRVERAVGTAEK